MVRFIAKRAVKSVRSANGITTQMVMWKRIAIFREKMKCTVFYVMILKQKNIACLKPQTAVYIQNSLSVSKRDNCYKSNSPMQRKYATEVAHGG